MMTDGLGTLGPVAGVRTVALSWVLTVPEVFSALDVLFDSAGPQPTAATSRATARAAVPITANKPGRKTPFLLMTFTLTKKPKQNPSYAFRPALPITT